MPKHLLVQAPMIGPARLPTLHRPASVALPNVQPLALPAGQPTALPPESSTSRGLRHFLYAGILSSGLGKALSTIFQFENPRDGMIRFLKGVESFPFISWLSVPFTRVLNRTKPNALQWMMGYRDVDEVTKTLKTEFLGTQQGFFIVKLESNNSDLRLINQIETLWQDASGKYDPSKKANDVIQKVDEIARKWKFDLMDQFKVSRPDLVEHVLRHSWLDKIKLQLTYRLTIFDEQSV